jgi:hypothetical protein
MAKGILWNATDFHKKMNVLQASYPSAADRIAGQVAIQVLNDATMESPTVPIDIGNLRSMGTFLVMQPTPSSVRFYVGYNTPYAARVHNVPMNFQDQDAGNEYLSIKLRRHANEYLRVWATKMRRLMGGG